MTKLAVESELTPSDWIALQAAWGQRVRARVGRARLVGALIIPLLAGVMALVALSDAARSVAVVAFVVGGCSFILSVTLTQRLLQRAGQPATGGSFVGPVRVTLSSEGVRTYRPHATSMTRWSAVNEVTRTDTHVFLWVDSSSAFVLPVRDLTAGLDPGGLVEQARAFAGLPRGAPATDIGAAVASSEQQPDALQPPTGFARALWQRLRWRAAPETSASSSDGVIAATAAVALTVWLAFDRHAAGARANLYLGGLSGLSWYALGIVGLPWVLCRATSRAARYRSLLAAVIGALPLALIFGLSIRTWAPSSWQAPCYVALGLGLTLFAHRMLVATTGGPQPRALAAAALSVLLFALGTSQIWVHPFLWYAASAEEGEDAFLDAETLFFGQAERIDAAAAALGRGRPDRPDVFFLGFAGVGEQKVFAEEAKLSESVVARRYGATGRSLLLVNDRRDRDSRPFATVSGLKRALIRMGEHMDRDEDVLFLLLTSHGSDDPELSVSNGTWPLSPLGGQALREALDASGIRWRVIVISACHSGAFIDFLANENTIVVTSSAADKTSFGCSDDNDLTDFGAAFMRDALPGATSLSTAFEAAKTTIEKQERLAGLPASSPQSRFGRAIAPYWTRVERGRELTR